ncbi:MAG: hypothetical protein JWQ43_3716 [Glaciihabitans sp.]|nr:hypothetical protein [Glaciihabitans sp.]
MLADTAIYTFTGGEPPSVEDLRRRYTAQVVGHSSDRAELWFNWIIMLRDTGAAVGFVQATVQATVHDAGPAPVAELAWVIAPRAQRTGLASEAARLVQAWLQFAGIHHFTAHIHPLHHASMGVARRLGLSASAVVLDGETRWQSA